MDGGQERVRREAKKDLENIPNTLACASFVQFFIFFGVKMRYLCAMGRFRLFDEISLQPIRDDWMAMSGVTWRRDLVAAVTVALLTLPQAMAYAMLAGLPLSCGLLAAIFSAMMASTWGASRLVVFGPTNAIAILVQVGTVQLLFTHYRDLVGTERDAMALQLLMQLTLLVALFQVMGAAFRLGRLVRFVSQSVISGYLLGVAAAVVITQLYTLSGIAVPGGYYSFYEKAIYLIGHLSEVHLPTLAVGVASVVIMVAIRRYNNHWPAGLIMLATVTCMVNASLMVQEQGAIGGGEQIARVGNTAMLDGVEVALPSLNWRVLDAMIPFAFAVALLSLLETSSVARSVAAKEGGVHSNNQDLFALGLGNMVSALMGALPISASPSRTALNYEMGATTRVASILSCVVVALFITSVGWLVALIPLASLAALLLIAIRYIVDFKQLRLCMRATSSDAFVMGVTFLSCLLFSLDTAFYMGVALSITLYLSKAATPQVVECTLTEEGDLHPVFSDDTTALCAIRLIKVEGELFFGAANLFQALLRPFIRPETPMLVLIIQLRNARDIDATACLTIRQLCESLRAIGKHLILAGMTPSVMKVINQSGLAACIGEENLYPFDHQAPHRSLQEAVAHAEKLVAIEQDTLAQLQGFSINPERDSLTESLLAGE